MYSTAWHCTVPEDANNVVPNACPCSLQRYHDSSQLRCAHSKFYVSCCGANKKPELIRCFCALDWIPGCDLSIYHCYVELVVRTVMYIFITHTHMWFWTLPTKCYLSTGRTSYLGKYTHTYNHDCGDWSWISSHRIRFKICNTVRCQCYNTPHID